MTDVPQPRRSSPGEATASMVLGIVSVVACVGGVLLGPLAVIFGVIAGKKGGYEAKSITGIVTGSIGAALGVIFTFFMVLGTVASVGTVAVLDRVVDEMAASTEPTADTRNDAWPHTAQPELTEAGIAASDYDTAYAAYLDRQSPSRLAGGIFEGAAIDTECFTFDGAPWWVLEGDPDTCQPEHQLWWETATGNPDEIVRFGTGGVGAQIAIETISDTTLERFGATDVASLGQALATDFLPAQGVEVLSVTSTSVGGTPAVLIECSAPHVEHYNYYVMEAPHPYDAAGGARYFAARLYNEVEWVYQWDDVVDRFEGSFTWK